MASKIQLRRDTSIAWGAANPVLSDGELGLDTTLHLFKVGDGVTAWNALPWAIQGATLDDLVTALGSTWSSAKIQAVMDSLSASLSAQVSNITTASSLSANTVVGNEGTTANVTITNYNAAHVYSLTTSDASKVTVSRTNDTLTLSLLDGGTSSASASIGVTVTESGKSPSQSQVISVTVNNVIVADTTAQITDFAAQVSYNSNWSYY